MMEFYRCLLVACLLLAQGDLTQGKISDACHGTSNLNETHNVMECEPGSQICITEVRLYTKQTFGCLAAYHFSPPPPECCRHDTNECSKVVSSAGVQNVCNGRSQCRVLSASFEYIFTPCPDGFSRQSHVRSITYWCSSTGSCAQTAPETTITTPRGNLQTTAQPKGSSESRPAGTPTATTQVNGKISDACHGTANLSETHNVMECEPGSQICITEVRLYTKQTFGCLAVYHFSPPPPECCRHDTNECSKVVSSAGVQNICNGRSQCRVLSASFEYIFTPCPDGFSRQSHVRSITYWCSSTGSCAQTAPETTITTPRGNLQTTAQPKESSESRPPGTATATTQVNDSSGSTVTDYTGVIAGCVVAVIVLVIGIVAAIFLSRWRRAKKRENPRADVHVTYLSPSTPGTPASALTNDPYHNLPLAPSAPPPNMGSYLSLHGQTHNTPYNDLSSAPSAPRPTTVSHLTLHGQSHNTPYNNLPIAPSVPPPNRGSHLSLHGQTNNTSNNNLPNVPSALPPNRGSDLSLRNQSHSTPHDNFNLVGGYMEPQTNLSFVEDIPVNEDPEYMEVA